MWLDFRKFFHYGSNLPPKRCQITPEHLLMGSAQESDLTPFLGDMSQMFNLRMYFQFGLLILKKNGRNHEVFFLCLNVEWQWFRTFRDYINCIQCKYILVRVWFIYCVFQAKRPRVLSESENGSEDPVKEPPASNNGYGFGGMPSPDVVQTRLELLQKSFPNKVSKNVLCLYFFLGVIFQLL